MNNQGESSVQALPLPFVGSKKPKVNREDRLIQVLPDVPAVNEDLTYILPVGFPDAASIIGSILKIPLNNRFVNGWVTGLDPNIADSSNYKLKPVKEFLSYGPPEHILKLADWAAHRWVGRRAIFYRVASPNKHIRSLPTSAQPYNWAGSKQGVPIFKEALASDSESKKSGKLSQLLRLPPVFDTWKIIEEALEFQPLILTPFPRQAVQIASRVKSMGLPVAFLPDDWAQARTGGCVVVGTRPAVFAPTNFQMILVLDEHETSHTQEGSPTYNTRAVAQKRATDSNIPCLLISPTPSQEAFSTSSFLKLSLQEERQGWNRVEVVDCLDTERRMEGLITEPLLWQLRQKTKKVVCILNRKGRVKLLACKKCQQLIKCKRCGSALQHDEQDRLDCKKCELSRKFSCRHCQSTGLKQLRLGVSKLKENMERLLNESITEMTAQTNRSSDTPKPNRIIVATSAALYSNLTPDVVAFLDFDQYLLKPHFRAHEQALADLARANVLLGAPNKTKRLLIQTRLPDHSVIQAVQRKDPSIVSTEEETLRQELGFPPAKQVAEIGKEGAQQYIDNLKSLPESADLEILGPVEGRYLIKADTIEVLSDTLNKVSRPLGKKLRIAINP